jgi:hypothetical protein
MKISKKSEPVVEPVSDESDGSEVAQKLWTRRSYAACCLRANVSS